MWFAGIDWADRHHDTVVIDEAGRRVAQLRVEHTPEGLTKLVTFLREIAPLDQIACILETNHGLLITTLLEAGLALYPVNPKTIDRKRSASGAKTDLIDAYLPDTPGQSTDRLPQSLLPRGTATLHQAAATLDSGLFADLSNATSGQRGSSRADRRDAAERTSQQSYRRRSEDLRGASPASPDS